MAAEAKMLCRQFIRFYASDKNALSALRKRTGYTFVNCKKALELHNNDVDKAENWLKEQAQALGWAKAQKLQGRTTGHGLIGLLVQRNIGALIEINCETDFVAKNQQFKDFVKLTSNACVDHITNLPTNDQVSKIEFQGDALSNLKLEDGKTLADKLALLIGNVGENATLRRATCFKVADSIQLAGIAHPEPEETAELQAQVGKYGTIIAFKSIGEVSSAGIPKKLCQQVIGMNATRVGDIEKDVPSADKDSETCLIFQEFLLDPTVCVGELLHQNKIEILDFQRFECGEELTENDKLASATPTN